MGPVALAFVLGHCCIHVLTHLPATGAMLGALAAGGAMAWATRQRWLIALLLGVAWAWGHAAARLADDLAPALEGQDVQLRGFVASALRRGAADPQFVFDVTHAAAEIPERIRLTWYQAPLKPQPGELWQLTVRLKRRSGFANSGGFDYEGHLFREGIGATGYVRSDEGNRRLQPASYRYSITRMRAWIAERIDDAAGDDQMLGVLQGLAVGDTQAITADQWRVFAATGITHLMAISGSHIGMVALLAAWLGGWIAHWPRAQRIGLTAMHGQVIAGATATICYSALAGLSIPTQRTLIMLCVYFAARWWRRELAFGQVFGLALIVVLIVDPFAPLAVGAWLSFAAVAAIVLTQSGRLSSERVLTGFARVQWVVTAGLLPVLIAAFGSLSLSSPLANALAVPLFTLIIVPTVLIGAFAASIDASLGAVVLAIPAQILQWSWPALEWLAGQTWSMWNFPRPSTPVFIALLAGVSLLLLPGIWPTRLAGLMLCVPMAMYRPPMPPAGEFELTVLDVGQGLAAVVRTHTHALLYDTGPAFQSGRDAGELAVLPYLHHRGIRRLDALVLSHEDLDHRGGLRTIRAALPVGRVLIGPSLTEPSASTCRRGQQWTWDEVTFTVLHPDPDRAGAATSSDNDSSCVLLVSSRAGSALLTGDIEAAAEGQLLERGLAPVDVVVVPHHGSGTSSTSPFVAALHPDVAIFSAGYRNRWNLPRPQIVERWRHAGARTHSTSDGGALELSFRERHRLVVNEYRRTHRRYWHRG